MKPTLSDDAFVRLRRLLADGAGLVFDDSRRDSLSYSVNARMKAIGVTALDAYLALVEQPRSPEVQALLDDVTIPETYFFRNPPQFRALRQHVLPELVSRAATSGRRLRIWSAGCSTGEEAYSLAILLRELLPVTTGWDIQIVGTDISTKSLSAARAGRYGARSLGPVEPETVERCFDREGDEFVVRPEIRELVEFRHHNLVSEAPPFGRDGAADLVLCRNVTIYFARETTRALMARLHGCLRDGGYLFLGHSETLWQVSDAFRLVSIGEAFVYSREALADRIGGEQRTVLPDRRTADEASRVDSRLAEGDRRSARRASRRPPGDRPLPVAGNGNGSPPGDSKVTLASAPVPAEPTADPLSDARQALRDGDYQGAADLAAKVAAADPLLADAYSVRGLALSNLGRDADALNELRKAAYVDPQDGFTQFLLGGTLARLGDAAGAARAYRAAAETLGESADDHVAAELGGRRVSELVDLCWQLAGGRP